MSPIADPTEKLVLDYRKRTQLKLFITQFLLPHPFELLALFFASILVLLIATNRTLLVILSGSAPVTDIAIGDVFGQRMDHIDHLLQVPLLGRIILFLFWLAIGSAVYMLIWLFQNLAIGVYDGIAITKLKSQEQVVDRVAEATSTNWWGTPSARTIFMFSSVVTLLVYIIMASNFLFPAWVQLFQIGLQSFGSIAALLKLVVSILGNMLLIYGFVLFWRLFFRLRGYIYSQ